MQNNTARQGGGAVMLWEGQNQPHMDLLGVSVGRLPAYAAAMYNPVLTQRVMVSDVRGRSVALAYHAMRFLGDVGTDFVSARPEAVSGTDVAGPATRRVEVQAVCGGPVQSRSRYASSLCALYGMPGTELGYGATTRPGGLRGLRPYSGARVLCSTPPLLSSFQLLSCVFAMKSLGLT
eukprot:3900143-Rhodomonas_salina.3